MSTTSEINRSRARPKHVVTPQLAGSRAFSERLAGFLGRSIRDAAPPLAGHCAMRLIGGEGARRERGEDFPVLSADAIKEHCQIAPVQVGLDASTAVHDR